MESGRRSGAESDIRGTLLRIIDSRRPKRPTDGNLQSTSVLAETAKSLGALHNHELEEAILTVFHDLFRTGYLAWGHNLANPNPPFFHVTDVGRRSLRNLSRDPGNPDGYFAHVTTMGIDSPIALSYLREAVECYTVDLPKAAAVMVGAAAECLTLELRDAVVAATEAIGEPVARDLRDWRIKTVLDAVKKTLDEKARAMPSQLRESYSAYWPAFTQQIRAVRNEAGHPTSVDPISLESVHGSLLIFPELGGLSARLKSWIQENWPAS